MPRSILLFLAAAAMALPATKTVATPTDLDAALAAAQPGDTIVLRNGEWKDARLNLTTAGTAADPITVRAETGGKVVFTGASSLVFAAPYVAVEGVQFRGGALAKGSVITFRSHHCRLSDSAIVNYNPSDLATAYYWIFFEGSDNRVERAVFEAKNHMGPLAGNAIKDARRNSVTRSYFHNIGSSRGKNGMEIFRVWGYGGSEELGDDGAFFTIEGNLFDHADGESMEIVSLKSNRNRVTGNTIRATLGGITNRSGNFNTIADNVILCDGRKGAYGMRVTGQFHHIENNYIAHCDYGITLMAGEFIDRDLTGKYDPIRREGTPLGRVPRYNWPRRIELVNNTLIDNAGPDLYIGGNYRSGWPASQRILLPEDNHITGNIIVKSGGGVSIDGSIQDTAAPLDVFHFAPNRFSGNILHGGEIRLKPLPEGFADRDPKLPPPPKALTPNDVGPAWTH